MISVFFGWPQGGVWANLVASAVLGVPAFVKILHRLNRNHLEHLRLMGVQHQEHLNALALHHEQVIQAIRTTTP